MGLTRVPALCPYPHHLTGAGSIQTTHAREVMVAILTVSLSQQAENHTLSLDEHHGGELTFKLHLGQISVTSLVPLPHGACLLALLRSQGMERLCLPVIFTNHTRVPSTVKSLKDF